jgi:hypothetical protein
MPKRPARGMRLPRHVSYLALLLAALLGLGLFPIGDGTATAAWGQGTPQATSPDSTETTAPETTVPESTESTLGATSTTQPCATVTTDTGTTEPCATTTTLGELIDQARDDLQTLTPEVIVDSAAAGGTTMENPTSILVTNQDAATDVAVAKQPGGDVKVAGVGAAMDVGLPAAPEARPARVGGNLAVFAAPDPDQAAVAVQPRDTGARVMVIIRSPDDPQTYRFPVKIPAGGRLEPMAGGKSGAQNTPEERNTTGYVILDRHNQGVGSIAAPWAQDSAGQPVPTWYTREPDAIVQHVSHLGAHYPVVADPLLSVGCAWVSCAVVFSPSVTSQLAIPALVGAFAFTRAAGRVCLRLPHPVAAFVCEALVVVAEQAIFGNLQAVLKTANTDHSCLRVTFNLLAVTRFATDGTKACHRGAEIGRRVQPVRPGSQDFVTNRQATFTVVGGALFWIPSTEQLGLLTGDHNNPWGPVKRISTKRVRRYRDLPANGTLFQEVSNSRLYYVAAGHCWYVNGEQFNRRGFKPQHIKKVPDGGLRQCPNAGELPPQ